MRYALIADLVNSRRVKDRQGLSRRLQGALASLGATFVDEWLVPITNAKGIDELSAALMRPDRAFDIATALNELVWPEEFRWALGAGTIDIGLDSGDAGDLDGTAFHAAADALRRGRSGKLLFALALPGVDGGSTALIEAAALAHAEYMQRWSERQRQFVRAVRGQQTQLAVAEQFGVSAQTVSQSLRRAGFDTMRRIEEAICRRLTEVGAEVHA
ncbi:MAG: hypothetical protein DYG94_11045 [Leptolyngbya sp. PLA3]|nr:MAG: hypothetical protein EDM82_09955 [Cyanobacteria bacterium CYA]MCE7969264.1 hypothetical protein [Leptolyngbya sp. PL-A3]